VFCSVFQIACVHISGLLVRAAMNAGQDGFRDEGSKQMSDCGFRRSPATRSVSKEAMYSDPKPAIIPI
jgi:hypothetical protein